MQTNISEEVLVRQIDAVIRLIHLFPAREMTIHDAVDMLARAEDEAEYVCGFIDLNQYSDEKNLIAEQLVARGFGDIDGGGHIRLAPNGQARQTIRLPEPIEQALKANKS